MNEERLGQRLVRPAKQMAGSGGAASVSRWAIVRVIDDPADLEIKVEYARRGRNYTEGGDPSLDYGRWVGEHEFDRGGATPPDESAYIPDYLHTVKLWPHMCANDFAYFLFPHAYDPGNSQYRDTHVDDTDIIPLWRSGDSWIAVPIDRQWRGSVSLAAQHNDCTVEG